MWMINRVHGNATHMRLAPKMTNPPGLPVFNILVIRISYFTYRGSAFHIEDPHLSRWHSDMGTITFLTD